jgi:hypothetical protein
MQGAAALEIPARNGNTRFMSRFARVRNFLINPSAKSLGGLWRSWRISEKIRLSRQIALERSSTG